MIANPVIVVEVLSPANAVKDMRGKLQGYLRVPSVRHYPSQTQKPGSSSSMRAGTTTWWRAKGASCSIRPGRRSH
jgi:hypothetical protein